jgi:hypothetical protein
MLPFDSLEDISVTLSIRTYSFHVYLFQRTTEKKNKSKMAQADNAFAQNFDSA